MTLAKMGFGLNGIGLNGYWPNWELDQVALDEMALDEMGLDEVAIPLATFTLLVLQWWQASKHFSHFENPGKSIWFDNIENMWSIWIQFSCHVSRLPIFLCCKQFFTEFNLLETGDVPLNPSCWGSLNKIADLDQCRPMWTSKIQIHICAMCILCKHNAHAIRELKGCGIGTLFVLVSPCFTGNVVVTCKIGSFFV